MSTIVRYSIAALAIIGVAVFFLWKFWNKPVQFGIKPRSAQEFLLNDYDGRQIKLSDFRGKPVIINAWAAWCPFCVQELSDFAFMQEELKDTAVIIAINRGESPEVAKRFSDKTGVTGRLILVLDPSDSFYQSIGGFSMPETIFVDKEGLIRDHKRGPMNREEMKRRTQQAFGL